MNLWEIFSTILIFIFGLVSGFFVTFLKEKGKNLAIQQDIGKITEEIENVKLQNNLLLEEVRGRHQLRMAALDRRLQTHQDACMLFGEICQHIFEIMIN